MSKMNPEVKARWVAALRSGEYKQAKSVLRRNGSHCCLGVLCDLYAQESGAGSWLTKSLSEAGRNQAYNENRPDHAMPGATVCIWAGLDPHLAVRIGHTTQPLADHNDTGHTFVEIADAIEAQL